jgi:hypothetical protein
MIQSLPQPAKRSPGGSQITVFLSVSGLFGAKQLKAARVSFFVRRRQPCFARSHTLRQG